MQGLWKSEAPLWKKESRRKKQKRKHFLKDKRHLYFRDTELVSENKREKIYGSKGKKEERRTFQKQLQADLLYKTFVLNDVTKNHLTYKEYGKMWKGDVPYYRARDTHHKVYVQERVYYNECKNRYILADTGEVLSTSEKYKDYTVVLPSENKGSEDIYLGKVNYICLMEERKRWHFGLFRWWFSRNGTTFYGRPYPLFSYAGQKMYRKRSGGNQFCKNNANRKSRRRIKKFLEDIRGGGKIKDLDLEVWDGSFPKNFETEKSVAWCID